MNKKVSTGVLVAHVFWALVCSVGIYYIEGVIMMMFGGSVDSAISANVAGGAILFLIFYLIERKLVAEELTQRGIFIVTTYAMPAMYQGVMIFLLGSSTDTTQNEMSFIFVFTFILAVMALFFRGMLGIVNYYRIHYRGQKRI